MHAATQYRIACFGLVALLFAGSNAPAQTTTRYLAWAGWLEQVTFSPKLNATLDMQARYEYTDNDWFVSIVRPGITWLPREQTMFTAGFAWIWLHPNPNIRPARPEIRPWQEVSRKFKTKLGLFWPRVRAEQRFIREYGPEVLQENYSWNSFRIRFRCDWILHLGRVPERGIFLAAGNELFISIKPEYFSAFDQNRASAGAGFRFTPRSAIQLQYLNLYQQFSARRHELHHTIRLTFLHELVLTKKDEAR